MEVLYPLRKRGYRKAREEKPECEIEDRGIRFMLGLLTRMGWELG